MGARDQRAAQRHHDGGSLPGDDHRSRPARGRRNPLTSMTILRRLDPCRAGARVDTVKSTDFCTRVKVRVYKPTRVMWSVMRRVLLMTGLLLLMGAPAA